MAWVMASGRVSMLCGLKRGYLQDSMAGAQQEKCGEEVVAAS